MSEVSDVSEDICPVRPALDVRGVSECPAVSDECPKVSDEGYRPFLSLSLIHMQTYSLAHGLHLGLCRTISLAISHLLLPVAPLLHLPSASKYFVAKLRTKMKELKKIACDLFGCSQ